MVRVGERGGGGSVACMQSDKKTRVIVNNLLLIHENEITVLVRFQSPSPLFLVPCVVVEPETYCCALGLPDIQGSLRLSLSAFEHVVLEIDW